MDRKILSLSRVSVHFLLGLGILTGLLFSALPAQINAQKTIEFSGVELGAPIAPQYQIVDIGVVQGGDSASQGFGASTGGIGVGRSVRTGGSQAFTWIQSGGIVGLPNLTGRDYCVSTGAGIGANNTRYVSGTCATTLFGTNRLPVLWFNGTAFPLTLPAGQTNGGDANDVNAGGVAVGSVNSGSLQRAAIYAGNNTTFLISQTTPNGSFFNAAFGINDVNLIVGSGIDPNNAARNVGMVFNFVTFQSIEVGALSGANGALAFGVSNAGHVVGASMMNQGSGMPFIWKQAGGIQPIPLPVGTSQGSARAVNSNGWAVGTASSAFAIPFVYDGFNTHRLADVIPTGTGWDVSTNTSSAALGISDDGSIVGTGVLNGSVRAFALVPITNASVGGRVVTASGAGIGNVRVTISGGNLSSPVTVTTSPFGWYNFPGLHTGAGFTITVQSKTRTFALPSRTVTPTGNVTNFDFTAEP